ncbi:hypothetical protein DTO006G1_9717 [Penicillium roqueforti]|nr:hypothetical protein CBS147337_9664 [Penicillium roqueforti]KAI2694709.1 hypothetical protein CBS147372_9625 [Penicillium roqueforti]KAI2713052.1 hypothetical protein CBS147318_7191 [Penicillium roqueforti]KAI2751119.1 hypothetical protein DTO006G1_9717 [Penicillium roqueforti]KAI3122435.1 hypothetical protein CBS147326_8722 [Penicillium roqueforti]
MTKKGAPCKNSIKFQDTKIGHQKLNILAREPFDISTLQSKLCGIAKEFICARWHRQRQADQVGQQWYEAAVRNQVREPHGFRIASASVVEDLGQHQTSSASRRRPTLDNTDGSTHRLRQDPPVRPSTSPEPVQPIQPSTPFVTATMLRTNSVPWRVSPDQPAILSSASNVWAGVQDLTLQSFGPSQEVDTIHVDSIYCVFCLADDEDHANERVILRCHGLILQRRDADECSRNEGSLDALIRPLRVPPADAETNSIDSASESSTDREPVTARYSAPNEPRQSQLPQRSVESLGVSIEQSGPRRSARLAGAHLPRDSSTSALLRRSARLNSNQRR